MKTKNNYEALQAALIEDDNVNVGKTSDLKNFFILISAIVGILIVCFFLSDFVSDFFISHMSDKTQLKIEKLIDISYPDSDNIIKANTKRLDRIKYNIIRTDSALQNKSSFPITVINKKEVNACITPNGKIYITKGTLEQGYNDEELSFILAHELGHYAHRDHLKSISRQILMGIICVTISGQSNSFNNFLSGINDISTLSYSRKQEREADKYAGETLIKMYGNNNGGKNFILKIKDKEKTPDFIHYFTTHPAWSERLKILENM